nr:MAG TPA: hypothetical protein [Caudoviricetes sp.]
MICGRMPCTGRTVPSRASSPTMHYILNAYERLNNCVYSMF